jgi:hypothetical protein
VTSCITLNGDWHIKSNDVIYSSAIRHPMTVAV